MAIQFTDVPVDGLVPLICKIVVCIDWIAPTHKVVTEVKSIDLKNIANEQIARYYKNHNNAHVQ